nr:hypothetical protein 24 [bacterium]
MSKKAILEYFIQRENQYIKSPTLCEEFGLSDVQVRQIIRDLRREPVHAPIISDVHGFKYTKNLQEIERCVQSLRARALRIMATAKGLTITKGRLTTDQLFQEEV